MLEPRGKISYVLEKASKAKRMFKKRAKRRKKAIARKFYEAIQRPLPPQFQQTTDIMREAQRSYVPQVYPGKVTLFRSSKQIAGIQPDPTKGWGKWAAGGV